MENGNSETRSDGREGDGTGEAQDLHSGVEAGAIQFVPRMCPP